MYMEFHVGTIHTLFVLLGDTMRVSIRVKSSFSVDILTIESRENAFRWIDG